MSIATIRNFIPPVIQGKGQRCRYPTCGMAWSDASEHGCRKELSIEDTISKFESLRGCGVFAGHPFVHEGGCYAPLAKTRSTFAIARRIRFRDNMFDGLICVLTLLGLRLENIYAVFGGKLLTPGSVLSMRYSWISFLECFTYEVYGVLYGVPSVSSTAQLPMRRR
ncbi:hypothetical protein Tco_1109931 [Tanacetum coccineum]|uniref:Uncharacterized protein n=1 Tax=Tanacetum coccineum TaxID=301880 RepID=A0ABQ5IJT3_9ASTR